MKRRNFLQRVIGGATALFVPKVEHSVDDAISTPPPKLGDVYYSHSAKPNKRSGYTKGAFNVMDFSPDEVIGIEQFQGRCIVYCKHSIWEVNENCNGDGLVREKIFIA